MNIHLDDDEKAFPTPSGYVRFHNLGELQQFLNNDFEEIKTMIFDHDLQEDDDRTGYVAMKWLAERCMETNSTRFWPKEVIVKSGNSVGQKNMLTFAQNFLEKWVNPRLEMACEV